MCGYFGTKKIVLLNYPLGLSLLKYRNVWVFWNKKKSGSNKCNPLNSSIDFEISYSNLTLILNFFMKKKKKNCSHVKHYLQKIGPHSH